MRDSVTVQMACPPAVAWSLISDITRIGEFSPETFEAKWLKGATGPAVGARFKGHVKRNEVGPVYWTVCRVDRCEPEKEFAFTVLGPNDLDLTRWGYTLKAKDGGTEVSEWFEGSGNLPMRVYWAALGWLRGRRNRNDMLRTLERMKAVAEADFTASN